MQAKRGSRLFQLFASEALSSRLMLN